MKKTPSLPLYKEQSQIVRTVEIYTGISFPNLTGSEIILQEKSLLECEMFADSTDIWTCNFYSSSDHCLLMQRTNTTFVHIYTTTVTHPRGWEGDGWNTVNLCRLCFNPVINLVPAIVELIAQLCHAKDHAEMLPPLYYQRGTNCLIHRNYKGPRSPPWLQAS